MRVDAFKLAHWLNARKYTVAHAATAAGIDEKRWQMLLRPNGDDVDPSLVAEVAAFLRVEPSQIAAGATTGASVAWQSADEMHATRRLVRRDGIDFYNYYSLAGADGLVAPVVLDILCPADRVPALNEGHLEPAITVNLGPGDIHGRWGVELDATSWQVLAANRDGDRWITGDSYVEPSFCPHSYSLVDAAPSRIVSYTGVSNLGELIEEANDWPAERFERLVGACDGLGPGDLLDALLARRLHDRSSAARLVGVSTAELDDAVAAPSSDSGLELLRAFGAELGFDYRLLLPPERRWDGLGKTRLDVAAARRTVRELMGYRVASVAAAAHLPDLVGAFVDVDGPGGRLCDCAETHYFVTAGEPTLHWAEGEAERRAPLSSDGSAWVPPFVEHWWSGAGSVLKLGTGRFVGYQAWLELSNTFAPAATLRRGYRDLMGWGYDN